jgi:hypothetical protein
MPNFSNEVPKPGIALLKASIEFLEGCIVILSSVNRMLESCLKIFLYCVEWTAPESFTISFRLSLFHPFSGNFSLVSPHLDSV